MCVCVFSLLKRMLKLFLCHFCAVAIQSITGPKGQRRRATMNIYTPSSRQIQVIKLCMFLDCAGNATPSHGEDSNHTYAVRNLLAVAQQCQPPHHFAVPLKATN